MADPTPQTFTLSPTATALYQTWQQKLAVSSADDGTLAQQHQDSVNADAAIIAAQADALSKHRLEAATATRDAQEHEDTASAATAFAQQLLTDVGAILPPPPPPAA